MCFMYQNILTSEKKKAMSKNDYSILLLWKSENGVDKTTCSYLLVTKRFWKNKTEQDPKGFLGRVAFLCTLFLVYRDETPAFMTFSEYQMAGLNSC